MSREGEKDGKWFSYPSDTVEDFRRGNSVYLGGLYKALILGCMEISRLSKDRKVFSRYILWARFRNLFYFGDLNIIWLKLGDVDYCFIIIIVNVFSTPLEGVFCNYIASVVLSLLMIVARFSYCLISWSWSIIGFVAIWAPNGVRTNQYIWLNWKMKRVNAVLSYFSNECCSCYVIVYKLMIRES